MRVAITGAGLIGCHAARELIARGADVTLLDVSPDPVYVQRIAGKAAPTLTVDVRELDALCDHVGRVQPDVVVHTVGMIGAVAQEAPLASFQVNVGGSINALEAAHQAGARRFVHASTLGVHRLSAAQHGPIDEDFPVGGANRMYPATKVACETVLPAVARAYGIELAMLRFGAVYGRGHFSGGSGIGMAIHELVAAAAEGGVVTASTRIMEALDLVYAKDVGRGVALAVQAPDLPYDVYNISGGALRTGPEIVETLAKVAPGFVAELPDRDVSHARRQPMDLTRSRNVLGYDPAFDLEAGLRDYLQDVKAERDA